MLRPGTSRLLLATFPRTHVRFFPATSPPKHDTDSRPPRSNDSLEESTLNSQSEYSSSTPSSSGPIFTKAGEGIERAQSIIRRWSEQNSIAFRHRTDSLIARLAASFTRLGGEINRVTGYDEIEALKRQVVSQEARISASRKAARDAKAAYEESVEKRSESQREVNSLLERKSMWTDADVSRFTALVREDHALEQDEARAKAGVARTEDAVEREFSALMRTILARYHEEQVWSDKIRSVSTYGQLAVLGANVLVFVLAIVLVEPWKRRRLMEAFERRVRDMEKANLDAVAVGMGALEARLEERDQVRTLAGLGAEGLGAPLPPPALALQEERKRPAVVFAGITLAREDAVLIAASMSAGIVAWTLRGWLGP